MKKMILLRNLWIAFLLLFLGVNLNAQWNNDYYSTTVRPTLATQNAANSAAASSTAYASSVNSMNTSSSAPTQTAEAILISLNHYPNLGTPNGDLQGCNNDMRYLLENLPTNGLPSQAAILSDEPDVFEGIKIKVQEPTRENITRILQSRAALSNCGRLIVAFAGHGTSIDNKSYLCLANASPSSNKNDPNLISLDEILSILKTAKAPEVILLLDACRNIKDNTKSGAGFMREFQDLVKYNDYYFTKSSGSFVIITSCSIGQEAAEDNFNIKKYVKTRSTAPNADSESSPNSEEVLEETIIQNEYHGRFFYHFVTGLTGAADFSGSYDGKISLIEAYNYAYSHVSGDRFHPQTPEIFMASSSNNMTLRQANLNAYKPDPSEMKNYLSLLLAAGFVLGDNTLARHESQMSERALTCVIDNSPNNEIAYTLRANVRRRLGGEIGNYMYLRDYYNNEINTAQPLGSKAQNHYNQVTAELAKIDDPENREMQYYAAALDDMNKIGQKFQLYIQPSPKQKPELKETPDGSPLSESVPSLRAGDLVTISAIEGNYVKIEDINNNPQSKKGWLHRQFLTWTPQTANETIGRTILQGTNRTISSSSTNPIGRMNALEANINTFNYSPGPSYN